MKTIIIWQDFQEFPKFVVLDGDFFHLNGVLIGSVGDEEAQNELAELLWDSVGNNVVDFLDEFPNHVVHSGEMYVVIQAGIVP